MTNGILVNLLFPPISLRCCMKGSCLLAKFKNEILHNKCALETAMDAVHTLPNWPLCPVILVKWTRGLQAKGMAQQRRRLFPKLLAAQETRGRPDLLRPHGAGVSFMATTVGLVVGSLSHGQKRRLCKGNKETFQCIDDA